MQLRTNSFLQGGKYKIEKVLGQGGFGITYLGTQMALNRKVAIKEFFMKEYCNRNEATSHVCVPSEGSKELVAKFKAKFIKEAQIIAKLSHPHIIRIHDIFEENGTAYYIMEYWNNGSLAEYVKSRGRLNETEALHYIRQIADALGYIHNHNMNHLDVKPGNILLDENKDAVLIDFGLSKQYDQEGNQTSTTPVGISHGYAPLEQYKKGGVGTFSPTTDIYSLGATLYKLLTGQTPPDANDVMDEGLPPLPSFVSSSTALVIKKAMQTSRKDRPQSVKEFLAMLDNDDVTDFHSALNSNPFSNLREKCHSILAPVIEYTSFNKHSRLEISSYTIKKLKLPILWIIGIISQIYVLSSHKNFYTYDISFYSSYCVFFTIVSLCMIGLNIYRIVGVLITYVPIIIYYCFEC